MHSPMPMHSPIQHARRSFLLGLAGVSVAAAVAAPSSRQTAAQPGANERTAGRGYQLSAHVRQYYRTLAV